MKPAYLTPLTAEQRRDVNQLIMFTEANRRPLRKPRIRKRDPKNPPRPANCFLVYRREKQSQIAELCKGANHRVISKLVAKWWKAMDQDTRTIYVDIANQLKHEHTVKFPDYKYTPKRKRNHNEQQEAEPAAPAIKTEESVVQPAGSMMMASEQTEALFYPSATPSSFNTFTHNLDGVINYNNTDLLLDPSNLFDDQTSSAHYYDTNGISNLLLCQPVVEESFDRYLTPAPLDTFDSLLGYPPWPDFINQLPWFQEQQQPIMNDFYTPFFESPPSSAWSEQQ